MRKEKFMLCRFVTGVSAALIALSFAAETVAQGAPSEPNTKVVLSLVSLGQPEISLLVGSTGDADVSERTIKPQQKPQLSDFHFTHKVDKASAKLC